MNNPFEGKAVKFDTSEQLDHLAELARGYGLETCKSIFSSDFPYYAYINSMRGYGVTNYPVNDIKIHYSDFVASIEAVKSAHTEQHLDMVNHPPHYTVNGIEVIDVIKGYKLCYLLGNVIKYVLRCNFKGNKKQDLQKAAWYLNRAISELE